MHTITKLTTRLDTLLQQYNPVNYSRLQPPLPDAEIHAYLEKTGIDDDNVFEFYRWKNGVFAEQETNAMLFYFEVAPLSLASVLSYKALYADMFAEHHIMLFSSPFDTKLLFNTEHSDDYGKLNLYSVPLLSIDDPYAYYDSLEKMLETTIKIYEAGAFLYDGDEDLLTCDGEVARSITRQLNVRSNYWQQ